MSIAMVLKIFSDCCVCFAILGSGPVEFYVPLLIPALVCGVCAGIATFFRDKGLTGLSKVCGLLPFLCLLLGEDSRQLLILGVPALYTAVTIFRGKLELEYYGYRRFLIQSLALIGAVYVVINVWAFLAEAVNDPLPGVDSGVILRYGLVHLLCGIVLQRQLRLGVRNRSEGGRGQISMLLAVAGTIVLALVVAEPLLRQHAASILNVVVSLMAAPLVLVTEVFMRVVNLLSRKTPERQEDNSTVEMSEGEGFLGSAWANFSDVGKSPDPIHIDPALVWIAFAVIALLAAAVILFRSFHKRRTDADARGLEGRVIAAPRKKKAPRLSTRQRVRQLYREFLKSEKNRGTQVRHCDTSGDILDRLHPETDADSARQLREVYLSARYDLRQEVSRSQLGSAKRAQKSTARRKTQLPSP